MDKNGARIKEEKVHSGEAGGAHGGSEDSAGELRRTPGEMRGNRIEFEAGLAALGGFSQSAVSAVSPPENGGRQSTREVNNNGAPYCPSSARVKTPKFSGKSDWEAFHAQFELLARAEGWSTDDKALQLAMCLTDDALPCLLLLSPEDRNRYEALVGALQRRFGQCLEFGVLRNELSNRSRMPGESLRLLANDIESLTRRAYGHMPSEVQSELARDQFIRALTPADLRAQVQLHHPRTLQAALEMAVEREMVWAGTAGSSQQGSSPAVRAAVGCPPGEERPAWAAEITELLRAVSLQAARQPRPGPRVCWGCAFPSQPLRPTGGAQQRSRGGLAPPPPEVDDITVSEPTVVVGRAGGTPVEPTAVQLRTVTGELAPLVGKSMLTVTVGGRAVRHPVWIAAVQEPCILGLDFLKATGCQLDLKRGTVRLQEGPAVKMAPVITSTTPRQARLRCSNQSAPAQLPQVGEEGLLAAVREVWRKNCDGLDPQQQGQLWQLLRDFQDSFAMSEGEVGRTELVQHDIDTGDAPPIKCRPRRLPLARQEACDKAVWSMQQAGIIEPSDSPWAAAVVMVPKKNGDWRLCADYRPLNDVTRKDSYPLPRIDESLDLVSGSSWFSSLDLRSGYYQPGLCNAPATFERLMDRVLAGVPREQCLVYLDDILAHGSSFEAAPGALRQVLERIRAAGLKLHPEKCRFMQREVTFLGHRVGGEGIGTLEEKVQAITGWPTPTNQAQVKSFVGLASYYRRFVRGFSSVAAPLYQLLQKDRDFVWTEQCQEAFSSLQRALSEAPVLSPPDTTLPFILDTDASGVGTGVTCRELQMVDAAEWRRQQEQDTDLRPVLQWVEVQQRPLVDEVAVLSKATKGLWAAFESLRLCDCVLQWAWKEPATGEEKWQVVVPKGLKESVLKAMHGAAGSGHFGLQPLSPYPQQHASPHRGRGGPQVT
ncbi:hypothetical protein AAFF_G00286490 [Aldrovandia affinis]|uniref:ribonuclease H n=1 Tax=Aldrovandia affinis TaxID=143900 RepID=A0AAD7TAJ9_9TELE|nr:hypothetical protein AAFF_G00286490 [Aldrovandia affinis]